MTRPLMTHPVMRAFLIGLGLFAILMPPAFAQEQGPVNVPDPVLTGIEFSVTVPDDASLSEAERPLVRLNGETVPLSYNENDDV